MASSDAPSSRHASIAQALREQIDSGSLASGQAVASESELAALYSVSRGTVRQALAALRAEGLITGGRGRRPVVARPALSQSFDQMVSFSVWAQRLGRLPGARTLEVARRPADPHTASRLAIEPETPVFEYKRLRTLDGKPAMIENSTFTEEVGRLLLDCDLDGRSVYAQLQACGVRLDEAQQTIGSVAASAEQAALLGIARRSPLLEVHRLVFDPDGHPVEWSTDTYRDEFTITIHNKVALARAGVGLRLVEP